MTGLIWWHWMGQVAYIFPEACEAEYNILYIGQGFFLALRYLLYVGEYDAPLGLQPNPFKAFWTHFVWFACAIVLGRLVPPIRKAICWLSELCSCAIGGPPTQHWNSAPWSLLDNRDKNGCASRNLLLALIATESRRESPGSRILVQKGQYTHARNARLARRAGL